MAQQIDVSRFYAEHRRDYPTALAEIRSGRKRTHWMWYVFPQLQGLGHSPAAQHYGIRGADEAKAYLQDPYLGPCLREISGALLELPKDNPCAVFDYPDDIKLRSSMTLFAAVSEPGSVFHRVLEKYYGGEPDVRTLRMLNLSQL